ncbi:MAG: hypothetical protein RL710_1779 [Pseudomonadota bacterium]|jgi:acyl-CoA reductase-like NAD-dependent aldehyde dehydrogenase
MTSKKTATTHHAHKPTMNAMNPATGEIIGKVPLTDMADMPEIFKQAREAQEIWAEFSFDRRRDHIFRIRDYVLKNAEAIAEVVSKNNGKTLSDAMNTEVLPCVLGADWYAKKAKKILEKKSLPTSNVLFANKRTYMLRMPMGVVGVISPWNYPFAIPFGEIIMGLMAGNAVLFKTASETSLVGVEIEKAITAGGLPDGLFRLIVGKGQEVSTAFFDNGIDKVFFTGSVSVGQDLMHRAAQTMTPLSLELGGNDAMIVLEDANMERAVNGAVWGAFQNSGQTCAGIQRIYVQESIAQTFCHLLRQRTETLRHGVDTGNFDIDVGSMTTQRQIEAVKVAVDDALEKGAKILAESTIRDEDEPYFYPCTALVDVDHSMMVMNQEVFGPVVGIMTFNTDEEAIALANDSKLGLTSSIWTMNNERGRAMATQLVTGVTTLNDHTVTHGAPEVPWLGWKQSGLGATHGYLGLEEMTRPKVVQYDIAPQLHSNLWWFPARKIKYELLLDTVHILFSRTLQERSKALQHVLPKLLMDPLLREKLLYLVNRAKHRGELSLEHMVKKFKKDQKG